MLELLYIGAAVAIIAGIVMAVRSNEKYCIQCGHIGAPKTVTRGSIGVEILLWLLFIIPGLIYSIWRHTTTGPACGKCGSGQIIPLDSPKAQKMRADASK